MARDTGERPADGTRNVRLRRDGYAYVLVKNRLRRLRAERGWSQADLAERLAVSRQTVNALETEKYDPSLPLAFKIARLFARPIENVFNDDMHDDAEGSTR